MNEKRHNNRSRKEQNQPSQNAGEFVEPENGVTGNCAQLDDYFDDDLNRGEREQFEAHLQVCTSCREEVESIRQLESELRAGWSLVQGNPEVCLANRNTTGEPSSKIGLRFTARSRRRFAASGIIGGIGLSVLLGAFQYLGGFSSFQRDSRSDTSNLSERDSNSPDLAGDEQSQQLGQSDQTKKDESPHNKPITPTQSVAAKVFSTDEALVTNVIMDDDFTLVELHPVTFSSSNQQP